MAKLRTRFVCQHCGSTQSQWMGQCPRCATWNSLVEESVPVASTRGGLGRTQGAHPGTAVRLDSVHSAQNDRIRLSDTELNRVLGGGLVAGSAVLLGGEPGIGKSTLMLQLALDMGAQTVLYVCGEESPEQVKMRAERLEGQGLELHLLPETDTSIILGQTELLKPGLLIVDSIQTLFNPLLESAPGTVGQIRESAHELIRHCKSRGIPLILIGHITKEGTLAGPKLLEHMVDVVLQFEGDRNHVYRLLRAQKNRFGSTAEIGIYEMNEAGLQSVKDPSQWLVGQREDRLSGAAVGVIAEGARPLLIEAQALVSSAVYGTPQRSSTGFDGRRLNMLLAVLEKRCGFRLGAKDVFLNITGGLRIDDPAADLAVAAAILSSNEDLPIHPRYALIGEIGLGGEVRAVSHLGQRLGELERLGYQKVFLSAQNKTEGLRTQIELVAARRIDQMLDVLFA